MAAEVEAMRSATASAWLRSILAAQEGPVACTHRGSGQAATIADEQLQHLLKNIARTVAHDFRAILARVRVGGHGISLQVLRL